MRSTAMVLAVLRPALAPFADGLGAHAEALGQHAGGLARAGDLLANGGGVRAWGWMDSITSSCGGELGVAGRQSAKRTPQSPNALDPNNVPLPNSLRLV